MKNEGKLAGFFGQFEFYQKEETIPINILY